MNKRTFKNTIYTSVAKMSKAFSNANRLEILDLLANGEKSVEQVATVTDISIANASHHLQILKNAKMVTARKEKNFIFYVLANQEVYVVWKAIKDLAIIQEHEVKWTLREFREKKESENGISYKEISKRKDIELLDVRPADEFNAGHIAEARSIPIQELPNRFNELPKNKTIITYCRGTFCTYADEAVQLLKKNGFNAIRLEESYLDMDLGSKN